MSDYFTWTKAVWVTARGKPLDFERRRYLVQIYQDQHPSIVYTKSSQMGLSERVLSESVWLPDQKGMNVLYCFPTQSHLQDFTQARLEPVLYASDYLASRTLEADNPLQKVGLKRIGNGHLYLRGSQNEKQIITIDADMVVLDERDRFATDSVPYIDKRMNASTLKWRREVSTPTYPDMGVDLSYKESDMRVWEIPCPSCGEWQELDFFKNIDFKRRKVVCLKCKGIMKRFINGRWRVTNPGKEVHGYKVNGMYNPTVTVKDLIKKYKKAEQSGYSAMQQFYNQDLGLPYEIVGHGLLESELNACKRSFSFPVSGDNVEDIYAGADVGVKLLHVAVVQKLLDNRLKILWVGTVNDFFGPMNSLESVMNSYKIKRLVVDQRPEVKKVKEFMDAFPGKVYAADYPNMKFSVQDYVIWDDVKFEVKLDRTISLDYLVSDIHNQKIEFPNNIGTVVGFYEQLQSPRRVTEKNKFGIETARWIEKGPDHFMHALNYARTAQSRGTVGKALLDYYSEPVKGLTANLVSWLKMNSRRI